MRKITIGILATILLGIGLVGLIFAKNHKNEVGHFGQNGFPPPFLVEKIADELGLSDEQKTNAKQILEEAKTRIEPLFNSIKESRQPIKDLGTDGNFDEAKVTQLADQRAVEMKQLFIEKEKTKAQLFAILTPQQREKARQMQEHFFNQMKGRFGHRFAGFEQKPVSADE